MKILGNILGSILAVGIVAALGLSGYWAAKHYLTLFARLDFTIAIVTGTAVVTLLVAALSLARSIRRVGADSGQIRVRAERAVLYKRLIDSWNETLCLGRDSDSDRPFSKERLELNHALALYGSAAVVKAHITMQSLEPPSARNEFASLLLQIRKELGSDTTNLSAVELLQLFPPNLGRPSTFATANLAQDLQPRITLSKTR